MAEDQLHEPWPFKGRDSLSKEEMNDWWANASEGQKNAMAHVYREYHDWQKNPANGWFGMDINPEYIQGVIRQLAAKYNVPLKYCCYNIYPS